MGCTILSDAKIDKEIDNRLAKANSAFGRLYKCVWNNKSLKCKTKISVYRAAVLSTLLYGSEAWITCRSHIKLLERFHQHCLRTILNIHWSDFVTNVEVLEQAEVPSIEAILSKYQLQAGRVTRMEEHRLPKIFMCDAPSTGYRDRGAPKNRYKDCLKNSLKSCNIDPHQLTIITAERDGWRHTVHTAVKNFETIRREALKEKRQRRNTRAAAASENQNPDQNLKCCYYTRTYLSRIGLVSHERACSGRGRPSF